MKVKGGKWIALTVLLGVVAHALLLVVIPRIAQSGEVRVNDRYFERSLNYLPFVDGADADKLRAADANPPTPQLPPLREFARLRPDEAAKYAFPILFPLDLVMMTFMTAFLAVGCVTFGSYVPWVANRTWLLIALPVLYLVFDFAEDVLLAWFLKNPDAISFKGVDGLKLLTAGKLITVAAAYLELAVLAVFAGWTSLRSS